MTEANNDDESSVRIEMVLANEAIQEPKCRPFLDASGFKLQVTLPSPVELQHATDTAELLYAGMDQISLACSVDSVDISQVRFTPDGASGLMMFFAVHASKVKELQLQGIYPLSSSISTLDANAEDEQATSSDDEALNCLALAFQDARLEHLDLSHNRISADLWQQFRSQTQLQSLILEKVNMDDSSLASLAREIEGHIYTSSLSKLVLCNSCDEVSQLGVESANDLLKRCTKLRHLRWAHTSPQATTRVALNSSSHHTSSLAFPLKGLNSLAQRMKRMNTGLHHLELEGTPLSDRDISGRSGLCSSLSLFPTLKTLVLKNVGLTPWRLRAIVMAIKKSRLPIEHLDLNENQLGNDGAKILAFLGDSLELQSSMRCLKLENNDVGTKGAIELFSGLASKGMGNVKLLLERNPLNMTEVAFALASSKREVEVQRDSIRDEHDRLARQQSKADNELMDKLVHELEEKKSRLKHLMNSQASLVSDIQALHQQVDNLAKEKETLVAAFEVLGASRAVEERNMLHARLERLEASVQKGYNIPRPPPDPSPPLLRQRRDSHTKISRDERSPSISQKLHSESDESLLELVDLQRPIEIPSSRRLSRTEIPLQSRRSLRKGSAHKHRSTSPESRLGRHALVDSTQRQPQRALSAEFDPSVALHEKLRERIATQESDRTEVLADIAQFRQKKGVSKETESTPISTTHESLEPPKRQESFRVETSKGKLPDTSTSVDLVGKAEVLLPEQNQSGHSVSSVADRPSLVRSNRSFQNQIATSDRFSRLLENQIITLERTQSRTLMTSSFNHDASTSSHTSYFGASSEGSAHSAHVRGSGSMFSESPVHSAHVRSTIHGVDRLGETKEPTIRPRNASTSSRTDESPVHSAHVRSTSLSVFLEEENRQSFNSAGKKTTNSDEGTGNSSSALLSTKEEADYDEDSSIADDELDELTAILPGEQPSRTKRNNPTPMRRGILRKATSLRMGSLSKTSKSRPGVPRTRSSQSCDKLDDKDVGKMRKLFEAYRDLMGNGSNTKLTNHAA